MHTIVEQPLTSRGTGKITCQTMGLAPISFVWHGPNGKEVETDLSGSEAKNVLCGRYRVVATDSEGQRADITVQIKPSLPDSVVVRRYKVVDATNGMSRDGRVEAIGEGLEGVSFLWTNGVRTEGTILRDVPCGTYSLSTEKEGITLVHLSPPAVVGVQNMLKV